MLCTRFVWGTNIDIGSIWVPNPIKIKKICRRHFGDIRRTKRNTIINFFPITNKRSLSFHVLVHQTKRAHSTMGVSENSE